MNDVFDSPPETPKGDLEHDASSNQSISHGQLKAIVERIERLEDEKSVIAEDIKEIYAEAKGDGFDAKILRQVIRRRKMDRAKREEQDALIELYEGVFG